jgi:signal transduction histidine kinase/ligand-binding sensor domain-containing protein
MSSNSFIAGGLLACQFFIAATNAQPALHSVGQLTTREGLSSNTINDILQDDAGFLWIATPDGLNRFDGTEVTIWYHLDDTNSLPHNYVSCLKKLPGNYLAIGTEAGLSFFNTSAGLFRNFYYHRDNTLDAYNNAITRLEIDTDGNIWAVSKNCIFIFDSLRQLRKVIPSDVPQATLITGRGNFVEKTWPLSAGRMLVHTSSKWLVYSPATTTLDDLDHSPLLRHLSFLGSLSHPASDRSIPAGNSAGQMFKVFDKYFLCIGDDRLSLYDENGRFASGCHFPFSRYSYMLWPQQVVPVDSSTMLFLFHDYGLATVSLHWQQGTPVMDSISARFFDDHEFETALRDRQGNWWLATRGEGLQKITPAGLPFTANILPDEGSDHAARHETIMFSTFGARLWIGTYGDGFYSVDPVTGQPVQHRLKNTGADAWANFIWNIRQVNPDTLWVGTQVGLFWYSLSSRRCGRLPHWPGKPQALDSVAITTQFADSHGLIWMGLGKGRGLCTFDTSRRTFIWYPGTNPEGYPFRYPTSIVEDASGHLWLTNDASSSLVRFDRATSRFTTVPLPSTSDQHFGPLNGIALEGDSVLWLGSVSCGLVRFDPHRGTARVYGHDIGLDNSHIGSVYRDSAGRLWVATEGGLSCFNPDTRSFTNYSQRNGLPGTSATAWFFYDTATRQLFNGGHGEYFYFRPDAVGRIADPPRTLITSILVNGKPWVRQSDDPVDFPPQDNDITIRFAAVDLNDGPAIRYAYRLKGIDTGWILTGSQRQINFSHLAPGYYVFEARAAGNNSDWNPVLTSFSFRIKPPFRQTGSFYFLLALTLALCGWTLHRYRQIQRHKTTQIRSEISRNLHDEVGANLTNISLSSLLAQRQLNDKAAIGQLLERIYEDSQQVSESMREIVWSINPDIDTLGEALPRMMHYASGLLEANDIELETAITPEVEGFRLNMRQRRDFYLIFKEAINNLARHSKASRALIRFSRSGHRLVMNINDNGSGFNSTFPMLQNGLKNMQDRARQHGWVLRITSHPGEGTDITLETGSA